jgi:RNA polymerase sigma factor (sigma-70 family)
VVVETEQHLLNEIRQGNKGAFLTLVDRWIPQAYRTALAILRSKQLAEEAVQNSLIELYSTIINGKEIRHVQGWFSRLIANRSLDIARKERSYKYSLDIDELEIQDLSASPLESVLKKEQSKRLIESVMALELQHRIVVVLYYFQELKIEEIATVLSMKEGTVKSRLYHARLKLSQMIPVSHLQSKEVRI